MNSSNPEFHPRNSCPLCGSDNLSDAFALDGFRVAACKACGFRFSRDILSPAALDQHYVDGYADRRQLDGQRVNASINIELLRDFCPDLSGKSLLDVGSGYGMFLDRVRTGGASRAAGVELSRAERRYSVETMRLETLAQIDDLSERDQFDIISLFEVIEHIPSPYEFVQNICKHLKPGGSLIIGTDNFVSDVVTVLGKQFPKWIPHEHVSFFDPASLKDMLLRSGTLKLAGTRSFTPWELLLRKLIYKATSGRKGGTTYNYLNERDGGEDRHYRYFALRRAINRTWFKISGKSDLDGEMMYVHMIKL